jgi:glucose-6-phosphate 1-epimerase
MYTVSFGREFSATLTVRNTGTRRFTCEAALHAYLRVGDVRRITMTGLEGASYLDRIPGHDLGPHPQTGDITFSEETDRIYHSTSEIQVVDPVLARRIIVKRKGSKDAVVWNPWAEKSEDVPDFGADEWTEMVCVDTANVGEHAVTLNPGKEHSMGFTLRVAPV